MQRAVSAQTSDCSGSRQPEIADGDLVMLHVLFESRKQRAGFGCHDGTLRRGAGELLDRFHRLPQSQHTEIDLVAVFAAKDCVVQVNNVFNNPLKAGQDRWVAFPRPQVIFQYYDGMTGELQYAEAITATK